MKHQTKICVLHAELTNKKNPKTQLNAEVLLRNVVTVSNSRAAKSPALGSLLALSTFSHSSALFSNLPAILSLRKPSRALLAKTTCCWLILQCGQRFFQPGYCSGCCFPAWFFSQLQNSFHFQRFLSPLILKFLRAGLKSWNVWCANHLQ